MSTTLLVKAIDITSGTPMSGNIDINKYLPVIKEVQVFVIEKLLGTKLYQKLIADFETEALTGDYLILLEQYVQPIIIHSTAAEYITMGAYTVANGGVYRNAPDNTESVPLGEISYLAQYQRDKADTYIQRMQVFLCDTNLPEYTSAQDEEYDIKPDSSTQMSGGWDLDSYHVPVHKRDIYGKKY